MLQPVLDIVIFFARHMVLAFVVFCGVWWLGPGRNRDWSAALSPAWIRALPIAISAAVLGIFAALAVWYLTLDGFAGEVEPVVSSLSWLVQSGRPLYTSFEQAERYSVLYGPSVFLTNGLFLRVLGPSLVSVKVASALAGLGSLVFLYAALARQRRDLVALAATAGAVLYYWAQGFAVYLVRPDALLVCAVAFGLFVASRTRPWLAVVAVAVAAGFAANLKIHGVFYFLPVYAVLGRRLGWRSAGWAVAGTAVVAVLPFVLYPQISAVNYVRWLTNEASHGLHLHLLVLPLGYAAFLLLPLAVVAWLRGPRHLGEDRLLVASLLPAMACALVLSAKQGSGIVHLLPLVPPTMFAAGRLVRPLVAAGLPAWDARLARSAAAAVVLTALLAGSVHEYRAVRLLAWQVGQMPGVADDVEEIMARYEGMPMAMACGGEHRSFRCTWLRPLLVFGDNPVLVDPISVMDTSKSGLELARATYAALTEGRVALWLVPRSEIPFQKINWYAPGNPIFPRDFVEHFQDCYTRRGQSRYFDLWFWNGLEAEPGAGLVGMGVSDR